MRLCGHLFMILWLDLLLQIRKKSSKFHALVWLHSECGGLWPSFWEDQYENSKNWCSGQDVDFKCFFQFSTRTCTPRWGCIPHVSHALRTRWFEKRFRVSFWGNKGKHEETFPECRVSVSPKGDVWALLSSKRGCLGYTSRFFVNIEKE